MRKILCLERTNNICFIKDVFLVVLASIFISIFSFIKIPLPFSPIPIAIQENIVFFLSILIGAKRAGISTILFITYGLFGLPVFSGCAFGFSVILGPTGGYLIGYVFAAFAVDYIYNKKRSIFLSMLFGNLIVFLFGFIHLSNFLGFKNSFILGIAPFILGDFLKIIVFSKIIKLCKKQKVKL